MSSSITIIADFKALNPPERSERIETLLAQFTERTNSNNQKVLSRVVRIIKNIDGDDKHHLNILATHLLGDEYGEISTIRLYTWAEDVNRPEITRPKNVLGWSRFDGWRPCSDGGIGGFLETLRADVRKHASTKLIGNPAQRVELPAEYCEFVQHVYSIQYDNWERTNPICDFGGCGSPKVLKLAELRLRVCVVEYDIAAGWLVGSSPGWRMAYLLSRPKDALRDAWRWRIISHFVDVADIDVFDDLEGLLDWYSSSYDWIDWSEVKENIENIHEEFEEERLDREEQEREEREPEDGEEEEEEEKEEKKEG